MKTNYSSFGIPLPKGIPFLSGRIGHFTNRPNQLPVLHLFKDYDLFYVCKGQAIWTFTSGQKMVVDKGHFALLPPYTPAWIDDGKDGLALQYCHFDFRPIPQDLNAETLAKYQLPDADAFLPLVFSARKAPQVAKAYQELLKPETDHDPSAQECPWEGERQFLKMVGYLSLFARDRGKQQGDKNTYSNPRLEHDTRVTRIRFQIDQDPAHPWRVDDLAASQDLSAGHLHNLCRRTLGCSLKTYIVNARLKLAVRLLKDSSACDRPSIREISENCGFGSQHFFSRQFKKKFGVGPLAFRNEMGPG